MVWVWFTHADSHAQTLPPVLSPSISTSTFPLSYSCLYTASSMSDKVHLKALRCFPTGLSKSRRWLCVSHTPIWPLMDNSFPGTAYTSSLLFIFSLTPFIPLVLPKMKRLQIGAVFLGFPSLTEAGGAGLLSCPSSSQMTSAAGLEQINRTKLVIDFNHY